MNLKLIPTTMVKDEASSLTPFIAWLSLPKKLSCSYQFYDMQHSV